MNHHRIKILSFCCYAVIVAAFFACSAEKYVADDELLLRKVHVVCDEERVKGDDLYAYCRQKPNTKWLSTFKVPLGLYSLSGRDTTKWVNRMLRKAGEKPVIIDTLLTRRTVSDLTYLMQNKGFLNAEVDTQMIVKGKSAELTYRINAGDPYIIRGVSYDYKDSTVAQLLTPKELQLHQGQVFSVNELNAQRKRIVSKLQNYGYYMFNKDFVSYDVDSSEVNRSVYVTMHIDNYRRNSNSEYKEHPLYVVRSLTYDMLPEGTVKLRKKVLEDNTIIRVGDAYNAQAVQQTYNNFSRLQAVRYTSIHFNEDPESQQLDCHIQLSRHKTHSLQFQPEGTNTAGDLGAAASATYQDRNVFHGSEVFSLTARAAYEAISGLEGYQNQDYVEYGVESSLLFPRILFPFVSDKILQAQNASSELTLSYNLQDRPEFHRRLFNTAWRYKWNNQARNEQYKLDLLDVNYLWMPWISETFKHDYLESGTSNNVILKYNYEDLLITKLGFGYSKTTGNNALRVNVESSGNLLSALSRPLKLAKNEYGEYKLLGIAFAQYVKGDVDYSHLIKFDERNALVLHGRLGVAYPYGNSHVLPFEKRYFAGGPNSVRGWSVRSLGPGRYKRQDGRIDFINQTGDIRLDLNVEMRSALFWKLQGAVFLDAGNIWTAREYSDQPGGQFHFDTFWQELAASYGIGFRLNFDYFVLRFDMGMKAINPSYNTAKEHFPIIYPRFSRDFAFHFAVGMPF